MVETNFKQTEIGLIPEDWEFKRIGDAFTFKNGLNKEKAFFGYGYPIVNYMDVYNNPGIHPERIKGKVFLNSTELKSFNVKQGDVLFTRTSETQEEIGIASVVLDEMENLVFSGFLLRGRTYTTDFNINFCQYCFRSSEVRQQIISKSSYTTRALTNGRLLSDIFVALPNLEEQQAIATALTDADTWIESLEKLIAKKRLIKQGAMQQLLTPKEDWEVKKLGEVCEFKNGAAHENVVDQNGNFIIINSKFISQEGKVRKFSNLCLCPLFKNEIVMVMSDIPNGKALAKCFLIDKDGLYTLNQRICAFNAKKDFDSKFLYFILNRNDYFLSFDSGTGQTNLRKDEVLNCPILFPNKKEQIKIAQILSDMDTEIYTLEHKLQKAQQIKQGMMQQLLTGKIRLVAANKAANYKEEVTAS